MNRNNNKQKSGVTLIELLVVISVMVVLLALVIPQLRVVTKDRAARESARIVGSALSDASSQARVDGFAGIAIARNLNIVRDNANPGTNPIYYASYQLFQLRQPPSYVGNEIGDDADVMINIPRDYSIGTQGQIEVVFPAPLDPNIDTTSGFVRLNGGKTRYRITTPVPGPNGGVLCDIPWYLEMPAAAVGVPFELIRDPILRQTSEIDLPQGYLINLNYSGPFDFGNVDGNLWTWTAFSQDDALNSDQPVMIIFDDQGGIDRIYPNGFNSTPFLPDGSVHLCVAPDLQKYKFTPTNYSNAMIQDPMSDVLDDPAVKWVSINHLTGSVVVTDNTPPLTRMDLMDNAATINTKKRDRIMEALSITGKRQSSLQ